MSVKSTKSSKLSKPAKIGKYGIEILAVFTSVNDTPVSLEDAMAKVKEIYSKKSKSEKPHVQKCYMSILCKDNEPHTIVIKSHGEKKVLENFNVTSMGTPQVGQLATQSLVFLPVLNKEYKSELFVFHPNTVTAQELVIKLVKLMQIKEIFNQQKLPPSSPSPPKSDQGEAPKSLSNGYHVEHDSKKENHDPEDTRSEYSLSSTFVNNWYAKVGNMVNTEPNSLYQSSGYSQSLNDQSDELVVLNLNLKSIRAFMNKIYLIMHRSTNDTTLQNGLRERLVKFPPKSTFVEIIQKIKVALNIAVAHECCIMNPSAVDIVNQLLLILKILADATKDKLTHQSDLIIGIRNPAIIEPTAKYLSDNLNAPNKHFWTTLGENYGYKEKVMISHLGLHRTVIDEFQIRKDQSSPSFELTNFRSHDRIPDRSHEPRTFDRGYERNTERMYDANPERMYQKKREKSYEMKPERRYEMFHGKSYDLNLERSHETNVGRSHNHNFVRHSNSEDDLISEDNYDRNKLSLSQPQLYLPRLIAPTFNDDTRYRSFSPIYDSDSAMRHIPDPKSMHRQPSRPRSPNHQHVPSSSSTWHDRQCRFIDAVQLRNGKLMKITRDRPAQNKREISVSHSEFVELLTDYGDMILAKNAIGEVGICPSSYMEKASSHP